MDFKYYLTTILTLLITLKLKTYLLRDRPDVLERQRLKLVVLEEVVQVLLEHLENETGVVLVGEALVSADEVELVGILLAQTRQNAHFDLIKNEIS